MKINVNSRKPQSEYHIEYYCDVTKKWQKLPGFTCMRKSFAEGAWSMLKAHYNQKRIHHLLCNGEVIDTCGPQTIKPS